MLEFKGSAKEIGTKYGQTCRAGILSNLDSLLGEQGVIAQKGICKANQQFLTWVSEQEASIALNWPWLLEEIKAVAAACEVSYRDLLLLNLRAWQFDSYGRQAAHCCSSFAITLADGTIACAGALDDPPQYYCGPVLVAPERGHSFISFPLTGTSWGNRGLNSAGLALGISSQHLPGLRQLPGCVNQDLALRVILQTCATVDEVQDFCGQHAFTMNLVGVDAKGGILCAHQTSAGFFEQPVEDGWCALTNHVAHDEVILKLANLGVTAFPEGTNSRARRGQLASFCRKHNRHCSAEDVREFIGLRQDENPGSIHNHETYLLTFAVPQIHPATLWVLPSAAGDSRSGFEALSCGRK